MRFIFLHRFSGALFHNRDTNGGTYGTWRTFALWRVQSLCLGRSKANCILAERNRYYYPVFTSIEGWLLQQNWLRQMVETKRTLGKLPEMGRRNVWKSLWSLKLLPQFSTWNSETLVHAAELQWFTMYISHLCPKSKNASWSIMFLTHPGDADEFGVPAACLAGPTMHTCPGDPSSKCTRAARTASPTRGTSVACYASMVWGMSGKSMGNSDWGQDTVIEWLDPWPLDNLGHPKFFKGFVFGQE